MNNKKMLDVVTMIANIILPDKCNHESALEIWLRTMKRKARESLESYDREPVTERHAIGNAAAMREALENSNGLLEELVAIGKWGESAREQIAENNAALFATARNCDVGTAEEQAERMRLYCNSHGEDESGCFRCEKCPFLTDERCELAWAQMPYETQKGACR